MYKRRAYKLFVSLHEHFVAFCIKGMYTWVLSLLILLRFVGAFWSCLHYNPQTLNSINSVCFNFFILFSLSVNCISFLLINTYFDNLFQFIIFFFSNISLFSFWNLLYFLYFKSWYKILSFFFAYLFACIEIHRV